MRAADDALGDGAARDRLEKVPLRNEAHHLHFEKFGEEQKNIEKKVDRVMSKEMGKCDIWGAGGRIG